MASVTEKYKPASIDAFAGLVIPRAVLSQFVRDPYPAAFLFLGPSGTGKTTMAFALAAAVKGEVHHIPSRQCDLDAVERLAYSCYLYPMFGDWHVVIVDEADQMTAAAQLAFLSKLDSTAFPPHTIFVFTANATDRFEGRFLSRLRRIAFDQDELAPAAAALLKKIYQRKARRRARKAPPPDFKAIVSETHANVRDALNILELELLVPGSSKPTPVPAAPSVAVPSKSILTLGLEKLQMPDLREVITYFCVDHVFDVRRSPKGHPAFSRSRLEKALNGCYRWLGDQLGEAPTDKGLDMLIKAAAPTLLVCAEEAPLECHRHDSLALPLIHHGIDALHIFRNELILASELQQSQRESRDYFCREWKE